MNKRILWKDAWKSIGDSKGRFIAIFLLMLVSTFALIRLKITGPDMQRTAFNFYRTHELADLTVTSNYGLDSKDVDTIKDQKNIKKYDFGYLQDSTVNNTKNSIRVLSNTNGISSYELTRGKMPKKNDEIAISYLLKNKYHIGQWLTLNEHSLLKNKKFKIVGFVRSSEYVDKNTVGQTTVGTGQLSGYGVVKKSAFDSKNYLIARLVYKNANKLNPYTDHYTDVVNDDKDKLQTALNKNRAAKYDSAEAKITAAEDKINGALAKLPPMYRAQAQKQFASQEAQIKTQKNKLAQIGYPKYQINNRTADPGYSIYRSNSEKIGVLANVFVLSRKN